MKTETQFPVENTETLTVTCQEDAISNKAGSAMVTCNTYLYHYFQYGTIPTCSLVGECELYVIQGARPAQILSNTSLRGRYAKVKMCTHKPDDN